MIILKDQSTDPLYVQIYNQIKEKIISGEMTEGSKIPSIRALSKTLTVSRNTVEYAYQQLCSEGYIASKARSGFVVQKFDNELFSELNKQESIEKKIAIKEREAELKYAKSQAQYDFEYLRQLSGDIFPMHLWRKLSNQCLSDLSVENLVSYNNCDGELELRTEIMKYLHKSRGVSCQPEQIVICPGTQLCLSLLCQLFRPYSTDVAIEDPGFDGARDTFINNGFNIIPIGLEEDGINLVQLENSPAKIVFITPSHQFPTGSIMPIQKRVKLLDWAVRHNGIIIEDDYDSELSYRGKPIPSLQSIDPKGRVIYVGTFSKSLSPALRLGYMVLPKTLIGQYYDTFRTYAAYVPWLEQKIMQKFMNLGYWERHLRRVCLLSKKKHDILVHTINELMGDKVVIHGKNVGLHVILEFNNGLSEEELIIRAQKQGVVVYPVSRYWIRLEQYSDNMIILGFSGMTESDIVEGIRTLNKAWFNA